ncbi:DUF6602 domain-containing protein [Pedobacter ginsengiterrae]
MVKKDITLQLLALYNTYADQINISSKMSAVLHGLRDIKASGNEIEITLRNILSELLPQRYGLGNGHVVDKRLNVSKQYDLIITENIDYRSMSRVKDSTELFYYESVYALGECKATWNPLNVTSCAASFADLRDRLVRNPVANNVILSGNIPIGLDSKVTDYPLRNPLFLFAFAVKTDKDIGKLKDAYLTGGALTNLPGITVVLNEGVFVLLNKKDLESGSISINIYPEFETESQDYVWRFIRSNDPGKNLSYLLFCLMQHLSSSILEKPPYLTYAQNIWDIDETDISELNEL